MKRRKMWMRFETIDRHPGKRWGWGAMQCMYDVLALESISDEERAHLESLRKWFNKHLPAPPRKKMDSKAIFWFKCAPDLGRPVKVFPWKRRPLTKLAARLPRIDVPRDSSVDKPVAAEAIDRVEELKRRLSTMGRDVIVTTTDRPGYIIYEDAYQVAAIPFKDTMDPNLS